MKKAINLLFWGYLIVFIRIDFGIDILPSPLGYFIIATGFSNLEKMYPVARKGWAFATAMIFISFPTIFIDVHQQTQILWNTYGLFILIFQLIIVYFILKLLLEITKDYGNPFLNRRTELTANIYIVSHLVYLAAFTLTPNLAFEDWLFALTVFTVFVFIMDLVFLMLIRRVRRSVHEVNALDTSNLLSERKEES